MEHSSHLSQSPFWTCVLLHVSPFERCLSASNRTSDRWTPTALRSGGRRTDHRTNPIPPALSAAPATRWRPILRIGLSRSRSKSGRASAKRKPLGHRPRSVQQVFHVEETKQRSRSRAHGHSWVWVCCWSSGPMSKELLRKTVVNVTNVRGTSDCICQ